MNETTWLANIIMQERGYVVVRWLPYNTDRQPCPLPGTIFTQDDNWENGAEVYGQMVVTQETDVEDMRTQQRILKQHCLTLT